MPPRPTLKTLPQTSTTTRPAKTQKTMWFLREFFGRFSPLGGMSTMPEWKKGMVMVFAYSKVWFLTSFVRAVRPLGAIARSVVWEGGE